MNPEWDAREGSARQGFRTQPGRTCGAPSRKTIGNWHPLVLAVVIGGVAAEAAAQGLSSLPAPSVAKQETKISPPNESSTGRLIFRVYNYAHVDGLPLATSEKVAAAIFAKVGVNTVWIDCPLSQAEFARYRDCQGEMGPSDVVLRILPHTMAERIRTRGEPLGFGKPCPETEAACEVSVFHDEVDKLATRGYRVDLILGHVIAHEVGHVLLGPGHSRDGIMRGEWSRYDLQRISWGLLLNFTSDQSSQVRHSAVERTTPHTSPRITARFGTSANSAAPTKSLSGAAALMW